VVSDDRLWWLVWISSKSANMTTTSEIPDVRQTHEPAASDDWVDLLLHIYHQWLIRCDCATERLGDQKALLQSLEREKKLANDYLGPKV
jgi:hypothetical protein